MCFCFRFVVQLWPYSIQCVHLYMLQHKSGGIGKSIPDAEGFPETEREISRGWIYQCLPPSFWWSTDTVQQLQWSIQISPWVSEGAIRLLWCWCQEWPMCKSALSSNSSDLGHPGQWSPWSVITLVSGHPGQWSPSSMITLVAPLTTLMLMSGIASSNWTAPPLLLTQM